HWCRSPLFRWKSSCGVKPTRRYPYRRPEGRRHTGSQNPQHALVHIHLAMHAVLTGRLRHQPDRTDLVDWQLHRHIKVIDNEVLGARTRILAQQVQCQGLAGLRLDYCRRIGAVRYFHIKATVRRLGALARFPSPEPPDNGQHRRHTKNIDNNRAHTSSCSGLARNHLNRFALATTVTDDSDIAAPATPGLSNMPINGYNTPAA